VASPNYVRLLAVLTAMMAAALVAGLMTSGLASAQTGTTFTVNSTNDPGTGAGCDAAECSLREAINAANNNPGADTINFNIPDDPTTSTDDVKTIRPNGPPGSFAITDTVTIDGYTQPGASKNTQAQGNDAKPLIELDGTNAGAGVEGLFMFGSASNSVVKGLVINRYGSGMGIRIAGGTGTRLEGNFIGTDASGTQGLGNDMGVWVEGANNFVGGAKPEMRNVISDNFMGVTIAGSGATGNKVEGNFIGTKKDGTDGNLGNTIEGVRIAGGSNNVVGGIDTNPADSDNPANIIAFNGSTDFEPTGAVSVLSITDASGNPVNPKSNSILGNSIFSNVHLGIDLIALNANGGVTPNDPKDPDKGPNNLQNFPVLSSATTSSITGKLNSRPRKTFTIQFFSNPTGTDEGKTLIGETTVKTNRKGTRSFAFTPSTALTAGEAITATATNKSTGDTSEFSAPVAVS
jgi:CSLREA domain-containing protein